VTSRAEVSTQILAVSKPVRIFHSDLHAATRAPIILLGYQHPSSERKIIEALTKQKNYRVAAREKNINVHKMKES